MGRIVYSMMVSLDGFVETPSRSLDWVIVDEELHRFINGLARNHEMFVNGRRLYEVMRAWETLAEKPDLADYMVEFAEIWNSKPKVVFSSTLESIGPNARLIRGGDVGAELAQLKQESAGDLDIGGPMLAATAIRLGLVDEFRLFVPPVSLGEGTFILPARRAGQPGPRRLTDVRSPRSYTWPIGQKSLTPWLLGPRLGWRAETRLVASRGTQRECSWWRHCRNYERTVGAQVTWETGISSRPEARWAHRLAQVDAGRPKARLVLIRDRHERGVCRAEAIDRDRLTSSLGDVPIRSGRPTVPVRRLGNRRAALQTRGR
jgi:dihydrofolate reductase